MWVVFTARLKPETVKKMIFLQGCFLQDMPQHRRAKVANERVQEFVKKQSQIYRNGPSEDFIGFLLIDCALGFIMMRMKRRVMMTWEKKVRARRRKI